MASKFKPHDLALMQVETSKRKRCVEVLSHPIPNEPRCSEVIGEMTATWTIMVRMVPGDATTLREVRLDLLESLGCKSRWVHVARVAGLGGFPEDMLRYDGAALCDPDQHEAPEDDTGRLTYRPVEPVLIYRVAQAKSWKWTTARWASFGWDIEPVGVYDLRSSEPMFARARGGDA